MNDSNRIKATIQAGPGLAAFLDEIRSYSWTPGHMHVEPECPICQPIQPYDPDREAVFNSDRCPDRDKHPQER